MGKPAKNGLASGSSNVLPCEMVTVRSNYEELILCELVSRSPQVNIEGEKVSKD